MFLDRLQPGNAVAHGSATGFPCTLGVLGVRYRDERRNLEYVLGSVSLEIFNVFWRDKNYFLNYLLLKYFWNEFKEITRPLRNNAIIQIFHISVHCTRFDVEY